MALVHEAPARIAVAVSGGSDSMGLLHVMAAVAVSKGWELHAVTVDHALRPEAAAEAESVARVCAGLGVAHSILRWEHGVVAGNLMDVARRARYALMADWAERRGISHILLGHTADDQAETFLMGLAREAGIDGLVGMRRHWNQECVRFLRPFLGVERRQLRDYLAWQGVAWVDDPSNENDRFMRVKARAALRCLEPLGIGVGTLSAVISHLSMAQDAVQAAAAETSARIATSSAGEVIMDREGWRLAPAEVRRRLLIKALRWVSGAGYAPRADAVARVEDAICQGKDAILAGCRIRVSQAAFRVVREPRAVAGLVAAPGTLWDRRWQVEGIFAPGQQVRALGAEGLRQCKGWRETGHSRDSLVVSPAIWYDDVLIAAPVAGFAAGFCARIVADFNQFVVSH